MGMSELFLGLRMVLMAIAFFTGDPRCHVNAHPNSLKLHLIVDNQHLQWTLHLSISSFLARHHANASKAMSFDDKTTAEAT